MSPTTMRRDERWRFLSESTIAVVSAWHEGESVSVPIWIQVEGDGVLIVTPRESEKARIMLGAGRAWATAHTADSPYRFAAAEGSVRIDDDVDLADLVRSMSRRSLGDDEGEKFATWWLADAPSLVVIRITPDRWRSFDESR